MEMTVFLGCQIKMPKYMYYSIQIIAANKKKGKVSRQIEKPTDNKKTVCRNIYFLKLSSSKSTIHEGSPLYSVVCHFWSLEEMVICIIVLFG